MAKNSIRRMVIVGGDFAGLNLAKDLDKNLWEVTIIDRNNYHSFPPLFYQVASSGLEPSSISFPLRREMRKIRGCRYNMGEVLCVDSRRKVVVTDLEELPYDVLVIATGTTNNFFGMDGLRDKVLTIKSTSEAIRCRNEILDRLERASLCRDAERRRSLLTFIIVGGGPTGVEIAGALGEMKRFIVPREYPSIDRDEVRVILAEGSGRLLGAMSEASSADALEALGQLMVDVKLGKVMKSYDDGIVRFSDGEEIATDSVIWTAGITGSTFEIKGADVKPGPGGRWIVDRFNRIEGADDIFALGDVCLHTSEEYPKGHPQLAQVAIQQAHTLARNMNSGQFSIPFSYNNKGTMATVGRNRAVVDLGRLHIKGRFAWIVWMGVHLVSLLGMRNKAVVLINWMWGYFTFSSGLRLLLRQSPYPKMQK